MVAPFSSRLLSASAIAALVFGLTACGGGSDGGEATAEVTVALNNLDVATGGGRISPLRLDPASVLSGPHSLAGTAADPTAFAIRIKSIYLVEDQDIASEAEAAGDIIGDNIGNASFLWTNQECGKAGNDEDCADIAYFDLNRTSEEVNAELNAQSATVTAGTYRYVKFGLLGEQQGGNNTYENTKWSYSGTGVSDAEFASIQTEWAAKFDEPLVVAEGDVVTLTVGYDLTGIVEADTDTEEKVTGNGSFQPGLADDCVTDNNAGDGDTCIYFPSITVSAAKE